MKKKNNGELADINGALSHLHHKTVEHLPDFMVKIEILQRSQAACHLILRYPTLGNYIVECIRNREYEKLIDFLFALETDNVLYVN